MKDLKVACLAATLTYYKAKSRIASVFGDDVRKQAAACEYWAARNRRRVRQGDFKSASGPGSTLENAWVAQRFLTRVIRRYSVKCIADVGCGDWHWMSGVDLGDTSYIGYDLVDRTIAQNRRLYAHRGNVQFEVRNAVVFIPPKVDLVILRDILFHLEHKLAVCALNNLKSSGSRYLLTTTFPDVLENEQTESYDGNLPGWGFNYINVELPPFGLSAPLEVAQEPVAGRRLALYVLNN